MDLRGGTPNSSLESLCQDGHRMESRRGRSLGAGSMMGVRDRSRHDSHEGEGAEEDDVEDKDDGREDGQARELVRQIEEDDGGDSRSCRR